MKVDDDDPAPTSNDVKNGPVPMGLSRIIIPFTSLF